jgi:hypothetical protein
MVSRPALRRGGTKDQHDRDADPHLSTLFDKKSLSDERSIGLGRLYVNKHVSARYGQELSGQKSTGIQKGSTVMQGESAVTPKILRSLCLRFYSMILLSLSKNSFQSLYKAGHSCFSKMSCYLEDNFQFFCFILLPP